MALEDLAWQGVDGDFSGLAELDVDDVGFVDFDLGGDHAHVGQGHEGGTLGVLDAFNDGFAFTDRLVGDDAVKRRDRHGEVEGILVHAQVGDLGLQVSAVGFGLCFGLIECRHGLIHGSHVGIVGRFFQVVVLLGHDAGLIKGLGALPVQPLLLQVGLGVLDIGLSGLLVGDIGGNIGFGGGDGGLLARTVASCWTCSTVATVCPS